MNLKENWVTLFTTFDWSVISSPCSKYGTLKLNNHEHRTKQTYGSYTFQPLMSF